MANYLANPTNTLAASSTQNKFTPLNSSVKTTTPSLFAIMALGAVGDTLGFGSGHKIYLNHSSPWELSGDTSYPLRVLNTFYKGHYRNIHFCDANGKQRWLLSDDSLLHFSQAQGISNALKEQQDPEPYAIVQAVAVTHVNTLEVYQADSKNPRCFGNSTRRTWRLIKDDPQNWHRYISYNPTATGCGGSMRGMIFGWLHAKDDDSKLITTSLNAGFLTNPSLVGALGCVSTAALTAFSLRDIPVEQWISRLRQLFHRVQSQLKAQSQSNPPLSQTHRGLLKACLSPTDWEAVHLTWSEYHCLVSGYQDRIPSKDELPSSYQERDAFHQAVENMLYDYKYKSQRLTIGDRGDSSVMLAIHGLLKGVRSLLDKSKVSKKQPESTKPSHLRQLLKKLPNAEKRAIVDTIVHFTVLHGGDCDSTGGIALSLYGSLFGTAGVKRRHVNETELMPEFARISESLTLHEE